jgi:hypothetical protein
MRISIPIETTRITVIAAKAMRILAACTSPNILLPAVRSLFGEIGDWFDGLPPLAAATELSQTPWDEHRACLSYSHLFHLGSITLIFRRTLSIYRHKSAGQRHVLQPAERSQLATIFSDGIVAAEQSSRILHLFLGEQAGIRHCWAIMYVPPSILMWIFKLTVTQIHCLRVCSNLAVQHEPDATARLPGTRVADLP